MDGKHHIPALLLGLLLIGLDQLTKQAAFVFLRTGGPVVILPGWLELRYLENRGAAFGMLKNRQWIFILFALLIASVAVVIYRRLMGRGKRFLPMRLVCIGIFCGGIGNMADRIIRRFVVDFIYFRIIDFPVFNLADVYVCLSCAALFILVLFVYRDEDFASLFKGD